MGQLQRRLSLAHLFFELDGEQDAIRKPFLGQLQRRLSLAHLFFELDGEQDAIRKPFLSGQKKLTCHLVFWSNCQKWGGSIRQGLY